jgi:mono/diheme cytochrome c family protein
MHMVGGRHVRRAAVVAAILLGLTAGGRGLAQERASAPALSAEDTRAREAFLRVCASCHPADRITTEGRSRAQWETTIIAMQTSRGATVSPQDFDLVLDYLTKFHGRDAAGPTASPAAAAAQGGARGGGAAPSVPPTGPRAHVGAADRHRVDPAAAARGQRTYAAQCVTCHGAQARGTERGANLVRSERMLRDRYGSAIGPFLKSGHPMQTGSAATLTEAQIADLSHFIWDRINSTLRGAPEFDVKDVLTGDPAAGRAYFNGAGGCASCHSPTGDLAGYGARYAPVDIQQRVVFPGSGRRSERSQVTVTVTPPAGAPTTGALMSLDDFHVALRDERGRYRSWRRTPDTTVVKHDPLDAHVALLDRLTDTAMHDVVAYLESLK